MEAKLSILLAFCSIFSLHGSPTIKESQVGGPSDETESSLLEAAFEDFVTEYRKLYASDDERQMRFEIFCDNLKYINQHNRPENNHSFTVGMNQFGDLTVKEFAETVNLSPRNNSLRFPTRPASTTISPNHGEEFLKMNSEPGSTQPSELDWRTYGMVTEVKSQGSCGSCWAFSTTGTIESMWAICNKLGKGGGPLTPLSEQQLVDCTYGPDGNHGCQGGEPRIAIEYTINTALQTEMEYPYTGEVDKCKEPTSTSGGVPAGGIDEGYAFNQNEETLYEALYNWGPVSVCIQANLKSFQLYSGGVYDDPACTYEGIDHCVLTVGYGDTNGDWIIKNSWGTSWGNDGYMMMKRGVGGYGMCGIAYVAQTVCVCCGA